MVPHGSFKNQTCSSENSGLLLRMERNPLKAYQLRHKVLANARYLKAIRCQVIREGYEVELASVVLRLIERKSSTLLGKKGKKLR